MAAAARRSIVIKVGETLYNDLRNLPPLSETHLALLRNSTVSLRKRRLRAPETLAFVGACIKRRRVLGRDLVRYVAETYLVEHVCALCGQRLEEDDEKEVVRHKKLHWLSVLSHNGKTSADIQTNEIWIQLNPISDGFLEAYNGAFGGGLE
jgi:hypothetical protein